MDLRQLALMVVKVIKNKHLLTLLNIYTQPRKTKIFEHIFSFWMISKVKTLQEKAMTVKNDICLQSSGIFVSLLLV